MIYGGFDLATPNIPTDSIFKVNLAHLFQNYPALGYKLEYKDSTISNSPSNLDNTRSSSSESANRGPNTPLI